MQNNDKFTFEISLSVLNHLGRNLYRSFATVLGEAISNAWDADAKNVYIYIDRKKNSFFIKDDGDGMTADDFQKKFLRVGYSKRKGGIVASPKGRPYIGRKGIGKLALLSCARKISVISKTKGNDYIGGVIDNSGLDKAITEDSKDYPLGQRNLKTFGDYTKKQDKGTIVYFEDINDGIKHSLDFFKKIIALYFRFSLLDPSFNIFVDNEKITHDCLDDLASKTEFLWMINKLRDPYIQKLQEKFTLKEKRQLGMKEEIAGFIASVERPRDLKIITTDERIGIDLFVNGRLRERDILRHIPTARIAENYFYGQIHFNDLDDKNDRFATSREGIIANDPKYEKFLVNLRSKISEILEDWDKWRLKHRKDGDPENERISRKARASRGLYNAVSEEYDLPKGSKNKQKVNEWVNSLGEDADFNFESYAECFISENLVRKYIHEEGKSLTQLENDIINKWKNAENENKIKGNISIELRQKNDDLSYLDMDPLAKLVDPQRGPAHGLTNDTKQYKPIRDALMHTALLTDAAKRKLRTVYENIKGRIMALLS